MQYFIRYKYTSKNNFSCHYEDRDDTEYTNWKIITIIWEISQEKILEAIGLNLEDYYFDEILAFNKL